MERNRRWLSAAGAMAVVTALLPGPALAAPRAGSGQGWFSAIEDLWFEAWQGVGRALELWGATGPGEGFGQRTTLLRRPATKDGSMADPLGVRGAAPGPCGPEACTQDGPHPDPGGVPNTASGPCGAEACTDDGPMSDPYG
jgi:hypothetical protein